MGGCKISSAHFWSSRDNYQIAAPVGGKKVLPKKGLTFDPLKTPEILPYFFPQKQAVMERLPAPRKG